MENDHFLFDVPVIPLCFDANSFVVLTLECRRGGKALCRATNYDRTPFRLARTNGRRIREGEDGEPATSNQPIPKKEAPCP